MLDTVKNSLPAVPTSTAGIGLRTKHYRDLIDQAPDIGWIEVHPENYFGGGVHRHFLGLASEKYPLSLHAVGLSLGAPQEPEKEHLKQFKELIELYNPFLVSDHVSWSASGNAHLNDLLPLPYTEETLKNITHNINIVQDVFGRQILVENPSSYMSFAINDMSESAFLNAIVKETDCGLLLDVNNIFVQANNHKFDAYSYIDDLDDNIVQEIHVAGHISHEVAGEEIFIDTHNQFVKPEVWELYAYAVKKFGTVPTLLEWDSKLPSLSELVSEAQKANTIIKELQNVA